MTKKIRYYPSDGLQLMIVRDELPRENGEHESVNSNENINVAASSPKISYCIKLDSIIVEIFQKGYFEN